MTQNFDPTTMPDFARRAAKYPPVSAALYETYGYPTWRRALPPLDELVDCILSQSTNDANRDRAFAGLKARFPDWESVMTAPVDEVVNAIKPAGLANQKAPRIQGVLRAIFAERGELNIDFLNDIPIDEAKAWLTQFDGVGPKTAAIVLCFAFNREAFPVDTHVHRLGMRIGFLPDKITADKAHPVMEAIVRPDDYYAFHLNLIWHGRKVCHARGPECSRCPLTAHCDYYQASQGKQTS
ncbi:MAG: endonuclease III [Pleurocapsa minor GSE-CHR-MK-17-07R]|jgi:endonuclease-3|nr:endonuclease III [Pleurocapsa minor GSE-CHR-MK 17-07R]